MRSPAVLTIAPIVTALTGLFLGIVNTRMPSDIMMCLLGLEWEANTFRHGAADIEIPAGCVNGIALQKLHSVGIPFPFAKSNIWRPCTGRSCRRGWSCRDASWLSPPIPSRTLGPSCRLAYCRLYYQ